MDGIVIEGLDRILKDARRAHMYQEPAFSFMFVESHSAESAARYNAVISAVAEVGWGFTGGRPTPVLGGGQVYEMRFIRDTDPGLRPPRLSGKQAPAPTEGGTDD